MHYHRGCTPTKGPRGIAGHNAVLVVRGENTTCPSRFPHAPARMTTAIVPSYKLVINQMLRHVRLGLHSICNRPDNDTCPTCRGEDPAASISADGTCCNSASTASALALVCTRSKRCGRIPGLCASGALGELFHLPKALHALHGVVLDALDDCLCQSLHTHRLVHKRHAQGGEGVEHGNHRENVKLCPVPNETGPVDHRAHLARGGLELRLHSALCSKVLFEPLRGHLLHLRTELHVRPPRFRGRYEAEGYAPAPEARVPLARGGDQVERSLASDSVICRLLAWHRARAAHNHV
mmetsp:Transcript_7990/g.21948  ORF Transcript_7990/g.21948 Transcript_7990/m.21948 type:complete len:294 (-) Transcript_7990:323-1204(-)